MSRTCDTFLWGYGLFRDIWAPIVESLLNLGLSILLGTYWGLNGILTGVLLSQVIMINSWKAYFLFKEAFKDSVMEYILLYTKKFSLLLVVFFLSYYVWLQFPVSNSAVSYCDWVLEALIVVTLYLTSGVLVFYLSDSDFRSVSRRVLNYLNA